jgi:hypothetical protein
MLEEKNTNTMVSQSDSTDNATLMDVFEMLVTRLSDMESMVKYLCHIQSVKDVKEGTFIPGPFLDAPYDFVKNFEKRKGTHLHVLVEVHEPRTWAATFAAIPGGVPEAARRVAAAFGKAPSCGNAVVMDLAGRGSFFVDVSVFPDVGDVVKLVDRFCEVLGVPRNDVAKVDARCPSTDYVHSIMLVCNSPGNGFEDKKRLLAKILARRMFGRREVVADRNAWRSDGNPTYVTPEDAELVERMFDDAILRAAP